MNSHRRSALTLGVVAVVACGGPSQFVVAEAVGCTLEGPDRVDAGIYEIVVSGDARVAIHRLDGDTVAEDVEGHIQGRDASTNPPGTTRVFRIENQPGLHRDRSAQNSTSGRLALAPGTYVFVCDWAAGDRAGSALVGSVDVVP